MPTYRITIHGNEYIVDVPNPHERPIRTTVNGEEIEVYVENNAQHKYAADSSNTVAFDHTITEPTIQQKSKPQSALKLTDSTGDIKSPLPGIIVSISVKEGDRVEPGQELCVLEAMKMNNPIRSTISGIVMKIHVTIGQQVQHGRPLMTVKE
jgi:biotin carboxyl carrier protein